MKLNSFNMGARRHLVALFSMALGSFGVFFLLHIMNGEKPEREKEKKESVATFAVQQKKAPPKKKKKSRAKPRAQKRRSASTSAPTPNLGNALRGASFDLPAFSAGDMGGPTQSLLGDTTKKMAMTEGAVDVPPKPGRRVQPTYPKRARDRGITGYVRMSIFVNESGSVEKVRVLESKPAGVFDEAASNAVRGWEFKPGQYEGESVSTWVTQTLRFELKKG